MMFGGIWLVFLISPVFALVDSDASTAWRIAGWAAVALFAALYLLSHLHPTPWRVGTLTGAMLWTGVLTLIAAVTIPSVGTYAMAFVPFLVAVSLFRLTPPWDVVRDRVARLQHRRTTVSVPGHRTQPPQLSHRQNPHHHRADAARAAREAGWL